MDLKAKEIDYNQLRLDLTSDMKTKMRTLLQTYKFAKIINIELICDKTLSHCVAVVEKESGLFPQEFINYFDQLTETTENITSRHLTKATIKYLNGNYVLTEETEQVERIIEIRYSIKLITYVMLLISEISKMLGRVRERNYAENNPCNDIQNYPLIIIDKIITHLHGLCNINSSNTDGSSNIVRARVLVNMVKELMHNARIISRLTYVRMLRSIAPQLKPEKFSRVVGYNRYEEVDLDIIDTSYGVITREAPINPSHRVNNAHILPNVVKTFATEQVRNTLYLKIYEQLKHLQPKMVRGHDFIVAPRRSLQAFTDRYTNDKQYSAFFDTSGDNLDIQLRSFALALSYEIEDFDYNYISAIVTKMITNWSDGSSLTSDDVIDVNRVYEFIRFQLHQLSRIRPEYNNIFIDIIEKCRKYKISLPNFNFVNYYRLQNDEFYKQLKIVLQHFDDCISMLLAQMLRGENHAYLTFTDSNLQTREESVAAIKAQLLHIPEKKLLHGNFLIDFDFRINFSDIYDYVQDKNIKTVALGSADLISAIWYTRGTQSQLSDLWFLIEERVIAHGVDAIKNKEDIAERMLYYTRSLEYDLLRDSISKFMLINDDDFQQLADSFGVYENYSLSSDFWNAIRAFQTIGHDSTIIEHPRIKIKLQNNRIGGLRYNDAQEAFKSGAIGNNYYTLHNLIRACLPTDAYYYGYHINNFTDVDNAYESLNDQKIFNFNNIALSGGVYIIVSRSSGGKSTVARNISDALCIPHYAFGEPQSDSAFAGSEFADIIQQGLNQGAVIVDSLKGILNEFEGTIATGGLQKGIFTDLSKISALATKNQSFIFMVYLVDDDKVTYGLNVVENILGSVQGVIWLDNIIREPGVSGRVVYQTRTDTRNMRVALRHPKRSYYMVAYKAETLDYHPTYQQKRRNNVVEVRNFLDPTNVDVKASQTFQRIKRSSGRALRQMEQQQQQQSDTNVNSIKFGD